MSPSGISPAAAETCRRIATRMERSPNRNKANRRLIDILSERQGPKLIRTCRLTLHTRGTMAIRIATTAVAAGSARIGPGSLP